MNISFYIYLGTVPFDFTVPWSELQDTIMVKGYLYNTGEGSAVPSQEGREKIVLSSHNLIIAID
jgi:hypothetical protein